MEGYTVEEMDVRSEPVRKAINAVRADLSEKVETTRFMLGVFAAITALFLMSIGFLLYQQDQDIRQMGLEGGSDFVELASKASVLEHRVELLEVQVAKAQAAPVTAAVSATQTSVTMTLELGYDVKTKAVSSRRSGIGMSEEKEYFIDVEFSLIEGTKTRLQALQEIDLAHKALLEHCNFEHGNDGHLWNYGDSAGLTMYGDEKHLIDNLCVSYVDGLAGFADKEIPKATATPAPNTAEYVTAWCESGNAKWLPESGNPNTARIAWVSDYIRVVTVTGPEIAFNAFISFDNKKDDEGLGDALRQLTTERQVSYLIVCHDSNGSSYELKAVKLEDGKQIWPVLNPVATATPDVANATPTPLLHYRSADPRAWEVDFQGELVEDKSERRYNDNGSYYPVATCSYQDLEAIKKVLNDAALNGQFVTFELFRRWSGWFLVGVGRGVYPVKYDWRVCPEWLTENGGGFDW